MKSRFNRQLILFILIGMMGTVSAQSNRLISSKKLKKDFKEIKNMIEAHPAPYRHITEERLTALIDSTEQLLNKEMDMIDFFKLMSPIYTKLKDGHSGIYIPYDWIEKHKKENGVFPYRIHLTEEHRLYLINDYSRDKTIQLGSEVLALNGVPTSTFIDRVSTYISYEQEIFRNSVLEKNFDLYLLLFFGKINTIELTYLSDKERKQVVSFIPYKDWKGELEESEVVRKKRIINNRPYEYEKINEEVGLIKIYSFSISNTASYNEFLRKMFKRIENDKITSLIIDVRGNTGGFPKTVSSLIHYISAKYFKTMAASEMKVSEVYQEYMRQRTGYNPHKHVARTRRHYIDLKGLFANPIGSLVRKTDFHNEPPETLGYEFKGDVYLLIDKRSYSASSSFAATFRCYQLGLLIGEETGGTKIFHANSMRKAMSHSNLIVAMATSRKYTNCFNEEEDEGIHPDLLVKPAIPQLVAQQDVALNYTLRVIKKTKKLRAEKP